MRRTLFLQYIFPVLFILLTAWHLHTQPLKFKRLGLAHGLSQSSVYGMVQDPFGFVWIATADGLNRYDGHEFKIYRHEPGDSLHSLNQNGIWTLDVDVAGNLWVGLMSRGLDRMDARSGVVRHFQHDTTDVHTLSSNRVRVIHCDERGFVWVGTADGGLNRIEAGSGRVQRLPVSDKKGRPSPGRRIKAILEDGQGWLIIASADAGLCRVHPTRLTIQPIPLEAAGRLFEPNIETAFLDPEGYLWIGPLEGGLWRSQISFPDWLQGQAPHHGALPVQKMHFPEAAGAALAGSVVKAIAADARGSLWIGTFTRGLFRLDSTRQRQEYFTHHPFDVSSLSSNQIFCLMVDRTGMLWIGTNGSGISIMDPRLNRIQAYRLSPLPEFSLPDKMVRSVLTDDFGGLWVGTSHGGLARIDLSSGRVRSLFHRPHPPHTPASADVRCLLIDEENQLWLGTYGAGLWRMEPTVDAFARNPTLSPRFVHYPVTPSPNVGEEIWCLLQDHRGILWMGSNDGLLRFDPQQGRWRQYVASPEDATRLAHPIVRALWLSGDSLLWVSTYGGLHRLPLGGEAEAQGRFQRYAHRPNNTGSLSSNAVVALWEYPPGYLWIGTFGGGLNLLEITTGRTRHWNRSHGLPADNVVAIRHDDLGGLWLSTTAGLVHLAIAELLKGAPNRPLSIRVFTAGDGFESNEFNTGAVHRDAAGFLYFGGIEGLNRFHPRTLLAEEPLYAPVITEIRVFDHTLADSLLPHHLKRVRLSHRENFLSFSFSSLVFHNPAGIRYRFRLKGLQEQWSESNVINSATYAGLPPGAYRFEVAAVSRDGQHLSEITGLEVIILPAFWQTGWFRLLVLSTIALAVWGLFRYRLARERELQRTRARIAADLHDEVASSLASIRLYSEIVARQLKGNAPRSGEVLARIRQQAQEVTESIAEIIWSVDPRHDNLGDLLSRIQDFACQVLPAAGIEFRFQGEALPLEQRLTPHLRRALYLILKEAITNAMRHSGAERLILRCRQHGAHLEVLVEDDGCGFNPRPGQTGRGLENMRARAREIGADFHIENASPQGTQIRLWLKLT